MKKLLTIFIIILVGLYTYAQENTIENIEVEQREDGTCILDIHFDLNSIETYIYNLTIEVSFDGGVTYQEVQGEYLSGDIVEVSPAKGLHIEWDGLASHPDIFTEEAKVKIIAMTDFVCGDDVSFIYRGEEITYGTVENPETGKCWMDRNLGASRVAISSDDDEAYGDLFQWGRLDDEHQGRTSSTTSELSSTDDPVHALFILAPDSPFDWRLPQNDDLWQGDRGINDPCPPGWRLPEGLEWYDERSSWISGDAKGAFASPLKLPAAGSRSATTGSINNDNTIGSYWSSTIAGTDSRYLIFYDNGAGVSHTYRASGFSVRCIKN